MRKDYLDLLVNDTEKTRRAKRFWFRAWCILMLVLMVFFSVLLFGVWNWLPDMEPRLKGSLTIFSLLMWFWLGWNTSDKWRNPDVPSSFLARIRKAGQ